MSNNIYNRYQKPDFEETMEVGYKEMGTLNVSLSEEALHLDIQDLECYEKYLVESE